LCLWTWLDHKSWVPCFSLIWFDLPQSCEKTVSEASIFMKRSWTLNLKFDCVEVWIEFVVYLYHAKISSILYWLHEIKVKISVRFEFVIVTCSPPQICYHCPEIKYYM
jgi:hypothetical protein